MPNKDRESEREYQRRYRAKNREKIIAYRRAYRLANAAALREKDRAYYATNRERIQAINRVSLRRNKEIRKVRRFDATLARYGVNREWYDAMLARQEGRCAICGVTFGTGRVHGPALDHDHSTGLARELLCGRCNKALGLFDESPARMRAAIAYIWRNAQEVAA